MTKAIGITQKEKHTNIDLDDVDKRSVVAKFNLNYDRLQTNM